MRDRKDGTYPGSGTKITEPFYYTKCICGKEFLRIHQDREVRCPWCGKTIEPTKKAC